MTFGPVKHGRAMSHPCLMDAMERLEALRETEKPKQARRTCLHTGAMRLSFVEGSASEVTMYPTNARFSRQQVSERTGISNDVLGYWMREGLIRSSTSSDEGRRHRRFDFHQVEVAAVLAELHKHGVNIGSLRSFSSLLQRSLEIGSSCGLSGWYLREAAHVARLIEGFHNGRAILVQPDDEAAVRPALTTDEILAHAPVPLKEDDDLASTRLLASSLKGDDLLAAELYYDMTSSEHFDQSPVSGSGWKASTVWHVGLQHGEWFVVSASEGDGGADNVPPVYSYLTIRVSSIVRGLWVERT